MKHYLKSSENFLFLKNKKDILSFNISAFVVDINFNYTTNRNNRKNKTSRIVYFNTNNTLRLFELSKNKFNTTIENFFKNRYIEFFNKKYPYRAIKDIEICDISLIETAKLDFDKKGLFIDIKSSLELKDILNYPNNLSFCETQIRYSQKNKPITKIVYSFITSDSNFNHILSKSKDYMKGEISLLLNNLTKSFKEKDGRLFTIDNNKMISNVKILDILKIDTLAFE